MDDKKILALARKNAAKSVAQSKPKKAYDATLDATRPATPDDKGEAHRMFKEMKRREF
ncbi:MAG TPA: hypothetical protein VIC55_03915 [Gemmatimonadaceae bacterium]|jgi:hypothetical protein